jgi:hypothetical protein
MFYVFASSSKKLSPCVIKHHSMNRGILKATLVTRGCLTQPSCCLFLGIRHRYPLNMKQGVSKKGYQLGTEDKHLCFFPGINAKTAGRIVRNTVAASAELSRASILYCGETKRRKLLKISSRIIWVGNETSGPYVIKAREMQMCVHVSGTRELRKMALTSKGSG